MTKKTLVRVSDLHGVSRLAIDATVGTTDLVETMHHTIAASPGLRDAPTHTPIKNITRLVYASIRGISRLVGGGLDLSLAPLRRLENEASSSPEREAALSALNGVLGDYLAATENPLTLPMQLRQAGRPLGLAEMSAGPASGKILLLVHGLCLNDLHWQRQGHDHGAALAKDLGYTPVYLHYNTGRHISTNGQAFAHLIETLVERWPRPVDEVVILGHSMGGLVARSACHYGGLAGHQWLQSLRKLVFLGTPHHGAPLERGGHWLTVLLGRSPYTTAFTRLGKLRSAGITDLGYGALLDDDWADWDHLSHTGDPRRLVPLPDGVQCYAMGATTGKTAGDLSDQLLGDGLVPLGSALGYHQNPEWVIPFPAAQQWIGYQMNHLDLLHHPDVYAQLRRWLAA